MNVDRNPVSDRNSSQSARKPNSFYTQTVTPSKNFTPRTHHTRFILMLATCDVLYRAHRHGSESPHPGSTPGLIPCNHLARQACGPWRTHRHNTYMRSVTFQATDRRDPGRSNPCRPRCARRRLLRRSATASAASVAELFSLQGQVAYRPLLLHPRADGATVAAHHLGGARQL